MKGLLQRYSLPSIISVAFILLFQGILATQDEEFLGAAYCRDPSIAVAEAVVPHGFCAFELTNSAVKLNAPRGAFITSEGHILVVERGTASVVLLVDDDGDLIFDRKLSLANATKLNHGLIVHEGYIYASAPSTVFRWPSALIQQALTSNKNTLTQAAASVEVVIRDMNDQLCTECGAPDGHSTRTLVFDKQNRLYITIGSATNVDSNSYRARMRRFNISEIPSGGIDFETGEVFADGMRNEVGLTFDKFNQLWGVENGCDNLNRADLGGDIHDNNPGEELNLFLESGMLKNNKHYGYPYCFTEFNLPVGVGHGPGSQWAHPTFINKTISGTGTFLDGQTVNDGFCQQMVPARLSMQAHSAPLGIEFFKDRSDYFNISEDDPECFGGFPEEFRDHAFISFHGSWNRKPPTGRKLVRVPFDHSGNVLATHEDFFAADGNDVYFASGIRPVDLKFDACGRMIVTSDGNSGSGSKVFMIAYFGNFSDATLQPTTPPTMLSPTPTTPTIFSPNPTKSPSRVDSGNSIGNSIGGVLVLTGIALATFVLAVMIFTSIRYRDELNTMASNMRTAVRESIKSRRHRSPEEEIPGSIIETEEKEGLKSRKGVTSLDTKLEYRSLDHSL